jgi:hypothetical protein
MPSYTIESIDERREWEGNYGPMVSYKVTLAGSGKAEIAQKPTTPAPTVGQTIEGTLEPSKNPAFPPKLKKAQQAFGGGGGRPAGRSPEESRTIVRQHSQHMALKLLALLEEKPGQERVRSLTEFFYQDAISPPAPAVKRDSQPDPSYTTDVPADPPDVPWGKAA